MDIPGKIKIRIRPDARIRIEVREKNVFHCAVCGNQYREHFLFCPQCLGELKASAPQMSMLQILSVPENRIAETAHLLRTLSGAADFPFEKALQSLPWIMITNTEASLLQHWKEVLEAEKAEVAIEPSPAKLPKRRLRHKAPLFTAKSPPPRFLSDTAVSGSRLVARSISDPALRFRWADTVFLAVRMVEDFYKRHPDHRILFSDFLYHIESELLEAIKEFQAPYGAREQELVRRIEKLRERLEGMAREMEEVRKQVEERL